MPKYIDITLAFDPIERALCLTPHSGAGNDFLSSVFANATGDLSPTQMIAIADRARMAGLVVSE
jgi:hypothetical protein